MQYPVAFIMCLMAFFLTCKDFGERFDDGVIPHVSIFLLLFFFFELEINSHTHEFHFLGQDQSTMAQRAKMSGRVFSDKLWVGWFS